MVSDNGRDCSAHVQAQNEHSKVQTSISAEVIFFFPGDRNEQGLTQFLPEVTDHILSFRRDHEIGEGFSADGVDARTVGGIHFHDGVDIQECSVAFKIRIRKLTLFRKALTLLRKAK